MSHLLVFLALVAAVLFQVTVAPLFPLGGATPDLVLPVLMVVVVYGGPQRAMVVVPVAAVLLSFVTSRAPGLLLLAYLPLLPLAVVLLESRLPLNRFAQSIAGGLATGLWARVLLALAAIAGGAEPQAGDLLLRLALPGLVLDALCLTAVYFPFRIVGLEPRPLSLRRSGYHL